MPRFYVGLSAGEKEIWKASNVAAEGNFLVMSSSRFPGRTPRPIERYKAALLALGKDADKGRQLVQILWLFRARRATQ